MGQPWFNFAFRAEADFLPTPLEVAEGDGLFFAFDFAAIAVRQVTAAMWLLQAAIRRASRMFVDEIKASEFFSDAPARLLSESIAHALGVSVLMGLIKRRLDQMTSLERAELYFAAHPGSPSAVCHPNVSHRSGTWVALSGPDLKNGIAGFGLTVEAALRAFDGQYLLHSRPPTRRRIRSPKFGEIPPSEFGH